MAKKAKLYARMPKAPAKYAPKAGTLRVKSAPAAMKSTPAARSNKSAKYVGSPAPKPRVKAAPAGMLRHPASHAKARKMDRTE